MGAISGSREPSQSTLSRPVGFDPERGDAEMLAILMWDYFGPHDPRTIWRLEGVQVPKATEEQVLRYRVVANHIAESLRFYRNIEFDPERDAKDALTFGQFIRAMANRYRERAFLDERGAMAHAAGALEAWEEPIDLTKDCAEAIVDSDLECWESGE